LIFLSLSCFGQYPRKANVAILEADNFNSSSLLKVCVDVIESEGFHVEDIDSSSLTLTTDSVVIHQLPLLFKLEIDVEGRMAAVRGYIMDARNFTGMGWQDIPRKWEEAALRSLPGSTWRTGFEVVVRIVEKLRAETSGKVHWDRW
jgi:hypothetical protein